MHFIDKKDIETEIGLIREFFRLQGEMLYHIGDRLLGWSGVIKTEATKLMYQQRGRFSQSFINVSMAVLMFLAIVFSGKVEQLIANDGGSQDQGSNYLLASDTEATGADTLVSDLPKGEITEYRVQDGDTVSSIAQKFGVSIDTIMWENNLKNVDAIKPKQILRILPITGVRVSVKRGETIYSISKKYGVDAQSIIDYPFNTFVNDETFALNAGQELMVPEGVKPSEVVIDTTKYLARTVAPPVPGVKGEGKFIWPTSGHISQKFSWYHKGEDIANPSNPNIVAAATGTVTTAGWNAGGYGNYVVIDHGNGYKTLYGHLLNNSISVKAGQVVNQGQKIGVMGSTGRSTGTHLHFEIRTDAGFKDPLSLLP